MSELESYPDSKDSGHAWLGEVPRHWGITSIGAIANRRSARNRTDLPLLSVLREKGVVLRSSLAEDENHNFVPDDLSNYRVAMSGDLVVNKMKAWQGSVGIAPCDGIVSPAYFVFELREITQPFAHRLFRSKPYVAFFAQSSDGVRIGQWDLSIERMKRIPVPIPPSDEQAAIVRFLAALDRRVNRFVRAKRRLIELLTEQKQAIITHAVTRGLDPNAKLKPSGIDWLGDVPEHWEVRRLKRLARMESGESITALRIEEMGEYPVYGGNGLRGYTNGYTHDGEYALIGRQGALCGNVHLVSGKFWASEHAVVPTLRDVDTRWFTHLIRAMDLRQYSQSAAQPGLSMEMISNLKVPFPEIAEQKKIVAAVAEQTKEVDVAINVANREIALIREYRTRLVSDVVTGKLDVRAAAARLPEDEREAADTVEEAIAPDDEDALNIAEDAAEELADVEA